MVYKMIATNIFDDDFNARMKKNVGKLEEYFKYYFVHTVKQWFLRMNNVTKSNAR